MAKINKVEDVDKAMGAKIADPNSLVYYDPSDDASEMIELSTEKVTITSENIDLSIRETCFYSFDNKVLLNSPKYLSPLFKTIDK